MEFLNKVELKGVVGRTSVHAYGSNVVLNFSVITEYFSRDANGNGVVESTWWNCTKIYETENPEIPIDKGDKVHVIGRLRQRRYITPENEERTSLDVICEFVENIDKENHLREVSKMNRYLANGEY